MKIRANPVRIVDVVAIHVAIGVHVTDVSVVVVPVIRRKKPKRWEKQTPDTLRYNPKLIYIKLHIV